jgi:hypothetical protein
MYNQLYLPCTSRYLHRDKDGTDNFSDAAPSPSRSPRVAACHAAAVHLLVAPTRAHIHAVTPRHARSPTGVIDQDSRAAAPCNERKSGDAMRIIVSRASSAPHPGPAPISCMSGVPHLAKCLVRMHGPEPLGAGFLPSGQPTEATASLSGAPADNALVQPQYSYCLLASTCTD